MQPEPMCPQGWALVIGIDEYPFFPAENQLSGCVNDARMVADLLRERFHLPPDRVRVLLNQQAQRAALSSAFEELAAQVAPEDFVVVSWSGHGSRQYEKEQGDEPDRWDETVVPQDSGRPPHPHCDITDDELRRWLLPLAQRAGQLIVWIDACRSASVLRDEDNVDRIRWVDPVLAEKPESTTGLQSELDPERYVLLAACADHEAAYELEPHEAGGKSHGAFSWHLAQELCRARPGITWREVYEQVRGAVQGCRPRQTPQLEGALDREVFQTGWREPAPFVPVLGATLEGGLRLGGGVFHGVTKGAIYGIHPPATRQPQPALRLARVQVSEVGAAEAQGIFLGPAPSIPTACRAFPEDHKALTGWDRYQYLLGLEGRREDDSLGDLLDLLLFRRREDEEWEEVPAHGEIPSYYAGERLGFTVVNRSRHDLFISVLSLGSSGGVSLLYPPPGGRERLVAGSRLEIGQGLRSRIRLHLKEGEGQQVQDLARVESIKLFATTRPFDLGQWRQSPLRDAPPVEAPLEKCSWTTVSRLFRLLPPPG